MSAGVSGLAPATTYHYQLTASNASGVVSTADGTFTTNTVPRPIIQCLCAARVPGPRILAASESHRIWREGNKLARLARRRPPVGTIFAITLNLRAKLTFTFTQRAGGRKVNGRCVVQTNANRRGPACKRSVTRGTLSFTGHAGRNRVAFQGRISRSKRLPPGNYTLVVVARNGGLRSSPKKLTFTIVR